MDKHSLSVFVNNIYKSLCKDIVPTKDLFKHIITKYAVKILGWFELIITDTHFSTFLTNI